MVKINDDECVDDLQLKGLKIIQKRNGFKFGVDAVLLSDFAKIKNKDKIVDLCTGTGIIPFLLIGKYNPSEIVGVEIQQEMVDISNRSAELNDVCEKIRFVNIDLKNQNDIKALGRFDVVTVNPPYKLNNSGIINPSDNIAIARHEIACNIDDVINATRILLKDNGRMYMVHRPDRLIDILVTMRKHRIEPKRIRMIHPNPSKAPNIVLIEGQRDGGSFLKWDPPLYVYDNNGKFSDQINKIYGRK